MPRFDFSLEDDGAIWGLAEVECDDDEAARDCAMQILSTLFANMHDDAPDWSSCRIRVASASGREILVSSAAQTALAERDRFRLNADVRTDH